MTFDSLHWAMLILIFWSTIGWYKADVKRRVLFEDMEDAYYQLRQARYDLSVKNNESP